jgi:hypothetical protein
MSLSCVRIRVRKTFQNLLKLAKIGKTKGSPILHLMSRMGDPSVFATPLSLTIEHDTRDLTRISVFRQEHDHTGLDN